MCHHFINGGGLNGCFENQSFAPLIRNLWNPITVMVNGQVLESGAPEQIRASSEVQMAYLGSEESHHG